MPWYVWLTLWVASVWFLWRMVKAGADEDAVREQLRRHLNEVA